jgi:hypothetical protein
MAIACTSPALATRPILTSEVSTWRIDVTDEGLIFVQELRGGRQLQVTRLFLEGEAHFAGSP